MKQRDQFEHIDKWKHVTVETIHKKCHLFVFFFGK